MRAVDGFAAGMRKCRATNGVIELVFSRKKRLDQITRQIFDCAGPKLWQVAWEDAQDRSQSER